MRSTSLLALCAALALPAAARANGRFPAAQHVVVGPGASSQVVALRATFGLILSLDGGRTWRWMCEEAMFSLFTPAQNFDAPIEVTSRGAVLVGYEMGINSTDDACKADEASGTRMRSFADLTTDPTGRTVYAIEYAQGGPSAVYRADSDALSFARMGAGVTGVLFDTIEVAPSNTRRLYASGRSVDGLAPMFFRSDDGGATLTRVTADAGVADAVWVSGVDPRDPDVVYVRTSMGLGSELRRSRDGGQTFQRIATTADPMLGFALSDDGRTLWYGSIDGGLHRSDDGGESFRRVNTFPVLCLRQHAGALWACSDWVSGPFALGRSRDGGQTFEASLRFNDPASFPGPPQCARRSEGAEVCVERWPMLQRTLENPDGPDASVRDASVRDAARDVARDAPADARDAAAVDAGPPAAPSGPCGCAVPGRASPLRGGALLALATALAAARRRRCAGRPIGTR